MSVADNEPSGVHHQGQQTSVDGVKANKDAVTVSESWLCLRFTHLGLNCLGISLSAPQAAAVTEQQQIWQCNELAVKSAVQPGMSVNHALMLNPALHLQNREPDQEAAKLQELCHWAYRFTSLVSVYNHQSLLLEVGKSFKLFKGLSHLVNLISNDLRKFNIEVAFGLAHTPKAAYVCSFNPQANPQQRSLSELEQLYIEHLDIDARLISQLQHCGLETLGELNQIPNAELGSRFGKELVHYLDQLWGHIADPQTGTTPPEKFHASADFAEPIRNLTWIDQQLDRLLGDLTQFLLIRQFICRSFTWRFYHENNRLLKTVTIGISSKESLTSKEKTQAMFKELTTLKLNSIELNWEFASIELSSSQLIPIQLFNDDLFDPRPDLEQFNQLIDRMINRLGHTALFRVTSEPEHLPELANGRRHAIADKVKEQAAVYREVSTQKVFKDEPLWLLEQPKHLPQHAKQPMLEGPLTIIHGPNRITSHWWAKLQSRDYFIARQRNGRLLWIYYDRGSRSWYLHGLFA